MSGIKLPFVVWGEGRGCGKRRKEEVEIGGRGVGERKGERGERGGGEVEKDEGRKGGGWGGRDRGREGEGGEAKKGGSGEEEGAEGVGGLVDTEGGGRGYGSILLGKKGGDLVILMDRSCVTVTSSLKVLKRGGNVPSERGNNPRLGKGHLVGRFPK